jgi:hypothetical protein
MYTCCLPTIKSLIITRQHLDICGRRKDCDRTPVAGPDIMIVSGYFSGEPVRNQEAAGF